MKAVSEVVKALKEYVPSALRSADKKTHGRLGNQPAVKVYDPDRETVPTENALSRPDAVDVDGTADAFDPVFEFPPEAELRDDLARISGSLGDEIRRQVLHQGIDALGWYVPFHYTDIQWGIYLPISGIASLASICFDELGISSIDKIHLAMRTIHRHELMHFSVNYAIAQLECSTRDPLYLEGQESVRDPKLKYLIDEEKLANALMLRTARWGPKDYYVPGSYQALLNFVAGMPPGYRDARKILATPLFREAFARLVEDIVTLGDFRPGLSLDGFDYLSLLPPKGSCDWRYCPVHVVMDGDRLSISNDWLRFISRVAEIQETKNFTRQLGKLEPAVQEGWWACKSKLAENALSNGLDFKPWRKGGSSVFSVRVNRGYRAHLRFTAEAQSWIAEEIGDHKAMGHD